MQQLPHSKSEVLVVVRALIAQCNFAPLGQAPALWGRAEERNLQALRHGHIDIIGDGATSLAS